jgi:soluble lytic murein transglycosylase-like protein
MRGGPAQAIDHASRDPYDPYIEMVARDNGVDPSWSRPSRSSSRGSIRSAVVEGAQGLMQLMPKTAAQYGVTNIRDPYQNLKRGRETPARSARSL